MVRFCLKRALRVGKMLASRRCSVSALGSQGFQAALGDLRQPENGGWAGGRCPACSQPSCSQPLFQAAGGDVPLPYAVAGDAVQTAQEEVADVEGGGRGVAAGEVASGGDGVEQGV